MVAGPIGGLSNSTIATKQAKDDPIGQMGAEGVGHVVEAGCQSNDGEGVIEVRETKQQVIDRMYADVKRQLSTEWFTPGLIRSMLCDDTGAGDRVLGVKILCGILATEASAAHRGKGGEVWPCRLCGESTEGGETNFHVLWRCNHSKLVVAERAKMVDKVWGILQEYDMIDQQGVVATALMAIQKGETVWNEIEGLVELVTGAGANTGQVAALRDAAGAMNGTAIDWARKGASGANWVRALVRIGVGKGDAMEVVRRLNVTLRRGSAEVWRVFVRHVHKGGEKAAYDNTADEVQQMLSEVFDEEENAGILSIGKQISSWPMGKKKKWLVQYAMLSRTMGKKEAILQARSDNSKVTLRGKQTLRGKFEEAKEMMAMRTGDELRQSDEMPTDLHVKQF